MDRRNVLGMLSAAAAGPFVPRLAGAQASLDIDVNNPDHVLLILRKLAHSLGEEPIFWWIRTIRYGLVDSAFTPMWGQNGGAIFITHDSEEAGTYKASVLIINFLIDPDTGQHIRTFKNPYTNEDMELQTFGGTEPIHVTYRRPGSEAGPAQPAPPGYKVAASRMPVGPALIEGDDVWVRSDNVFRMEPTSPDKGRLMQINDWSTYHGSLQDVANPDIKTAPATWSFNDINTWPRWMGMEGRPGNYVARGVGRKVFSIDDMPASWRQLMAKHHPDILDDPLGAVTG